MAKHISRLILLCLFSLSATANNLLAELNLGQSSNSDDFLPVDQAFPFNYVEQDEQLQLEWRIEDGYYLYQHQFTVSLQGQALILDLPAAEDYHDPYYGDVKIYRQALTLRLDHAQLSSGQALNISYQGCADAGLCYPPETKQIQLSQRAGDPSPASTQTTAPAAPQPVAPSSEQWQLADQLGENKFWLNIGLFFILGVGLAFTPCVFPMYPILTGIIAGQKKQLSTRQAFGLSMSYVQGMALTYTALGLVVASAGLQFQAALQHPVILGSLAVLFVLLACSMFGLYNLQLPSSWQQKLNGLSQQQQGGNALGVFVMGMISGLVASPCTAAPLSGVLIYVAQTGDLVLGGVILYSLSLGMGLPLLALGTSSGRFLPKAGAWMNQVKMAFGFMLLAVPIWLLERFISAQISTYLWLALALSAGAYYYHQNRLTALSVWQSLRQLLLLAAMLLAILWAVLPQWGGSAHKPHPEFIQVTNLAQMQQQLQQAAAQGEPVLVDFYADWCTACKQFEDQTFSDPKVANKLQQMRLIQADVTKTNSDTTALLQHYQILGLPTLLLFNEQGIEQSQARVTGFMNAEAFHAHLLLNGL